VIVVPQRSVATIDQMDAAMDLLRVVSLALQGAEDPAAELVEAIANTLDEAINKLESVRAELNAKHGTN
jgi:hypothetical protein